MMRDNGSSFAMPYDSNIVRLILLATFLAEGVTLWLVCKRHLQGKMPWFTTYVVYMLVRECVFYPLWEWGDKVLMFYIAWGLEAGAAILMTAFMMEIISQVFAEYEAATKLGRNALLVVGFILILIAMSTIGRGAHHSSALMKIIMVTERSVRIVHLGIIVAFFGVVRYLALSLRQHQFGILVGYGFYAAINLAVAALIAEVGPSVGYRTFFIDAITFICMFLIWISYLSKEEPIAPKKPPSVGPDELDGYKDALSFHK
jgi:hypothetical protein